MAKRRAWAHSLLPPTQMGQGASGEWHWEVCRGRRATDPWNREDRSQLAMALRAQVQPGV